LTEDEKKTWKVEKTLSISYKAKIKEMGYGFFVLFLALSFSPIIIALINQVDFSKQITSTYLNGLVTACGVFVAFISASVISNAKTLDSFDFLMMKATLLMFVASVVCLSFNLIVADRATILNLILFSITLILGSFTAWGIMHTMFRKSRSLDS
jgi:hypothetical protein